MLDLGDLFELNDLARKEGGRYPQRRFAFQRLVGDEGRHFVGIVGPRGVGKTVLLRQLLLELDDAFYLSADTLREKTLFDVARALSESYGVRTLLIDEIHFQPDFDQELKKIFDFVEVRIFFTSSVSLALYESAYDLSRRVRMETLYPFSFGEYLSFTRDARLPALSLDDIYHERFQSEHLRYGHLFEAYLEGGLFPFSLEEPDVRPLLENIVRKIIERDIPSVVDVNLSELRAIEQVMRFAGRAEIDGINVSSVSRNVGITKYKAEAYISILEKCFLLNPVYPTGANVLREPKVLMFLPFRTIYRTDEAAIGGLREDFLAQSLKMRGLPFTYLKTRRGAKTPDFLLTTDEGPLVVEVGGAGKGRRQFKGVEVERKMILSPRPAPKGLHRPLFLAGFVE
jgi:uncharacterized protein